MQLAISAQKWLTRNALTVVVSCVNHTGKPVADAMRSSARPAFSSIERSTRSLHQQTTANVENEKGHKNYGTATSVFFQSVRVIS